MKHADALLLIEIHIKPCTKCSIYLRSGVDMRQIQMVLFRYQKGGKSMIGLMQIFSQSNGFGFT